MEEEIELVTKSFYKRVGFELNTMNPSVISVFIRMSPSTNKKSYKGWNVARYTIDLKQSFKFSRIGELQCHINEIIADDVLELELSVGDKFSAESELFHRNKTKNLITLKINKLKDNDFEVLYVTPFGEIHKLHHGVDYAILSSNFDKVRKWLKPVKQQIIDICNEWDKQRLINTLR